MVGDTNESFHLSRLFDVVHILLHHVLVLFLNCEGLVVSCLRQVCGPVRLTNLLTILCGEFEQETSCQ